MTPHAPYDDDAPYSRTNRTGDPEDLIHTAYEALASLSILVGEGSEDVRRVGLSFLLSYILEDLRAALAGLIRAKAQGGAHG